MTISSDALISVYQAAKTKVNAGTADMKEQAIVGAWDACMITQARVKQLQQELDILKQVNAQSASTISHMTMRLAGAPAGTPVH